MPLAISDLTTATANNINAIDNIGSESGNINPYGIINVGIRYNPREHCPIKLKYDPNKFGTVIFLNRFK